MAASCGIPGCTRLRYERGGHVHGYCGRRHAKKATLVGLLGHLRDPHGSCQTCQLQGCSKVVFFESDTVHDYCCRRHAISAKARDKQRKPSGTKGALLCRLPSCLKQVYRDPATSEDSEYCGKSHLATAKGRQCVGSGCSSTAFFANVCGKQYCGRACAISNGNMYAHGAGAVCGYAGCAESSLRHMQTGADLGYCGEAHRLVSTQGVLGPYQARSAEPYVEYTFPGRSTATKFTFGALSNFGGGGGGINTMFTLSALSEAHPECPALRDQFCKKWIKTQTPANVSVVRIFRIEVPAVVRAKHEEYKETVATNVRRRFHGTSCSPSCDFFVEPQGSPCRLETCSVCNICMHGFGLKGYVGRNRASRISWLRYGEAMYFTSASGKANAFAAKTEKIAPDGARLKCMFVADVAAGNAFVTAEATLPEPYCPPQGHDSVVGEVGKHLNYDEIAVYKEEAALPTHLIVYTPC